RGGRRAPGTTRAFVRRPARPARARRARRASRAARSRRPARHPPESRCAASPRPRPDTSLSRVRIAIALFEGAEELDGAGPWEVLAMWAQEFPGDGVELFTVADTLAPIRCAKGLRLLADRTWDEAGPIDVLVVPGGDGTRPLLGDERWRGRLRTLADGGGLVTSVCTGALVLADAGLLDGRPATTYWQRLDLRASL